MSAEAKGTEGPEEPPLKKEKEVKRMRDIFKRARAKDGYCRLDCSNKQARARAKRATKKEIKEER